VLFSVVAPLAKKPDWRLKELHPRSFNVRRDDAQGFHEI